MPWCSQYSRRTDRLRQVAVPRELSPLFSFGASSNRTSPRYNIPVASPFGAAPRLRWSGRRLVAETGCTPYLPSWFTPARAECRFLRRLANGPGSPYRGLFLRTHQKPRFRGEKQGLPLGMYRLISPFLARIVGHYCRGCNRRFRSLSSAVLGARASPGPGRATPSGLRSGRSTGRASIARWSAGWSFPPFPMGAGSPCADGSARWRPTGRLPTSLLARVPLDILSCLYLLKLRVWRAARRQPVCWYRGGPGGSGIVQHGHSQMTAHHRLQASGQAVAGNLERLLVIEHLVFQ